MLDNEVTTEGTLLLLEGRVYLDGWELAKPGMCREYAILACLHTAEKLQKAAREMIAQAGAADYVVSDMPDDTPVQWLCDSTRRFIDPLWDSPEQQGEDRG